jgi:hypothetical protein
MAVTPTLTAAPMSPSATMATPTLAAFQVFAVFAMQAPMPTKVVGPHSLPAPALSAGPRPHTATILAFLPTRMAWHVPCIHANKNVVGGQIERW